MKKFILYVFFSIGFNQIHATINPQLIQACKRTCSYVKPILESSYEYIKAIDQKYLAFGALLLGFTFIYFKKNTAKAKVYKPIPKEYEQSAKDLVSKLWFQEYRYFPNKDSEDKSDTVWQNPLITSNSKTKAMRGPIKSGLNFLLTLEVDTNQFSISAIETLNVPRGTGKHLLENTEVVACYAEMKNGRWTLEKKQIPLVHNNILQEELLVYPKQYSAN